MGLGGSGYKQTKQTDTPRKINGWNMSKNGGLVQIIFLSKMGDL